MDLESIQDVFLSGNRITFGRPKNTLPRGNPSTRFRSTLQDPVKYATDFLVRGHYDSSMHYVVEYGKNFPLGPDNV